MACEISESLLPATALAPRARAERFEGLTGRTPGQCLAAFKRASAPLGLSATACDKCGIEATPLTVKEARALEPNLADNIVSVYRVPDSAVDGFRLVWHPNIGR